jgi:predicted NBD/HSP70 family sugar kinase
MKASLKYTPKYDPEFKPVILEIQKFNEQVSKSPDKTELIICLERTKGHNYQYKTFVFKDGTGHDDENYFMIERICKILLWIVGGYKLYIAGSNLIASKLKAAYQENGQRKFDYFFFKDVYNNYTEVISCSKEEIPKLNLEHIKLSRGLNGNRIGFDAGGSDRKVSAVINGEVKFSDETVWNPKINSDPNYHIEGIMDSFSKACEHMPTVDGVGISTAGIVVDNKIMVASLFLKVPKEDYQQKITNIYLNCVKNLEKKYNKKIPVIVANDGDVTALAGLMDLNTKEGILGIAMGTSEAGGYITKEGELTGWLSELAFVPIDFNKKAMINNWSGDIGCGEQYFSQEAVIKLAKNAGIKFGEDLTPANKLKFIQNMIENGNEEEKKIAENIFEDIGIYLGYTIPFYLHFYEFKHLLVLGRVVSGKGGNIMIDKAKEVLKNEFSEISKNIEIHIPDEKSRRVGQSVAAASLPEI